MGFSWRRWLPRGLVLLVGVLTLGVGGLVFWVQWYGRRDHARRAGAIVVLGARVLPGGIPSGSLVARVEQGAALFHAGLAPLLVLSGGGAAERAEAEVAYALATGLGVPGGACLLETESRSTAENARHSARLLRERGIREIILVTDPFHLLRASHHFRREGLAVAPSPARLDDRGLTAAERLYWPLREAFALLAAFLGR